MQVEARISGSCRSTCIECFIRYRQAGMQAKRSRHTAIGDLCLATSLDESHILLDTFFRLFNPITVCNLVAQNTSYACLIYRLSDEIQ